jgi:hypothetical protein
MTPKIEFGGRVSFTHRYTRKFGAGKKYWQRSDNSGSGIFLGKRTLADGKCYHDEGYGYIFEAESFFRAALVCPGPNTNPIYVPLDAIALPTEGDAYV